MKKILLYIWQLPQMVAGYFFSRIWREKKYPIDQDKLDEVKAFEERTGYKLYLITRESRQEDPVLKRISGVSLGKRICLITTNLDEAPHEGGHSVWSVRLGPLYFPVVGFGSAVLCNLWDRWFHKNWTIYDRVYWYYKAKRNWTERSADKAGRMDRDAWLRDVPRDPKSRYPAMDNQRGL